MKETVAAARTTGMAENIPMARWGRDHWSTFGRVVECILNADGSPQHQRMRCDPDVHPQFAHSVPGMPPRKYPARLAGGVSVEAHDDWSCLDDAETAGLLTNVGSGTLRRYEITEAGTLVAYALRSHKAAGGTYSSFVPPVTP
mgnify:CR=1 FL=1